MGHLDDLFDDNPAAHFPLAFFFSHLVALLHRKQGAARRPFVARSGAKCFVVIHQFQIVKNPGNFWVYQRFVINRVLFGAIQVLALARAWGFESPFRHF